MVDSKFSTAVGFPQSNIFSKSLKGYRKSLMILKFLNIFFYFGKSLKDNQIVNNSLFSIHFLIRFGMAEVVKRLLSTPKVSGLDIREA